MQHVQHWSIWATAAENPHQETLQSVESNSQWRSKVWKNIGWSDEFRYLLSHYGGWGHNFNQTTWKPGSIVPCTSGLGGGDVMLRPWIGRKLVLRRPSWVSFKQTEYCCSGLSIPLWSHPLMATFSRIMHQNSFNSIMFLEHDINFKVCKCTPQLPDLKLIEYLWDVLQQ